jgi:hypothetical protein
LSFPAKAGSVAGQLPCRDLPNKMAGEDKRIKLADSKLRSYIESTIFNLA